MDKDEIWGRMELLLGEEKISFIDFFNYFDVKVCEDFLEFLEEEYSAY